MLRKKELPNIVDGWTIFCEYSERTYLLNNDMMKRKMAERFLEIMKFIFRLSVYPRFILTLNAIEYVFWIINQFLIHNNSSYM